MLSDYGFVICKGEFGFKNFLKYVMFDVEFTLIKENIQEDLHSVAYVELKLILVISIFKLNNNLLIKAKGPAKWAFCCAKKIKS